MITGTCYFVSVEKAIEYYKNYAFSDNSSFIERKIKDGEIVIGRPTLKEGEKLYLIDNETRYSIVSA